MINVTETYLPDEKKIMDMFGPLWKTKFITNRGPYVRQLENELKNRFKNPNVLITTNGTLALQMAIRLLPRGEIITTSFSYIATTSSIMWEGYTPVFVDINPINFNIDVNKIEKAITSSTRAILATHVFGIPCNIGAIDSIAKKFQLKVIYDAAHCFDVRYKDESIFSFGDISICSFHATKLFHTAEGGGIWCNDKSMLDKVFKMHNFGHDGPTRISTIGINGKIDEFRAILGLSILDDIESLIDKRKGVYDIYIDQLNSTKLQFINLETTFKWNYSYFPVVFEAEKTLLRVMRELNKSEIYPRRYFYPALNTLPFYPYTKMEVSESISKRILCLPFHHNLDIFQLEKVIKIINKNLC